VKKLGGRASWRAVAIASPCPMRLGGSLALPIFGRFRIFSQLQGCRGGFFPIRTDPPLKAFSPSTGGDFVHSEIRNCRGLQLVPGTGRFGLRLRPGFLSMKTVRPLTF